MQALFAGKHQSLTMKKYKSVLLLMIIPLAIISCNKKTEIATPTPVTPPSDPAVANTIGFFLDNWSAKAFSATSFTDTSLQLVSAATTITINPSAIITKIPATLFGNNANAWMTQLVTEPVLMNHLRNLNPHIIRFPGGNISSVFFWNSNGPQPADAPDSLPDADGKKLPAGYWYGKNSASWTVSVDNYYKALEQTNSEGMITVNYAYARYGTSADPVAAAAHLAADWIRYDKGHTKYWEIGNESNGTWQAGYRIDRNKNKDGQPEFITGALYGQHVKRFADSMRKAAAETGKTIYIGAQLLEQQPQSWQTPTDQSWNAGVFSMAASSADFYIIHSYYTPYNTNSTAADILNTAESNTNAMVSYIQQNAQSNGAPIKPVALTEWNIFAVGSQQMVSHIAGLHSDLVLGELIKNKYGEASRWDLANGWENGNDQGMFSNGDEPGVDRWNPRPAFYHMYFFQKMLGDRLVASSVAGNANVACYASSFNLKQVGAIIINKGTSAAAVSLSFLNFEPGERYYWYTLTGGTENGEFSRKVYVNGRGPGGPAGGPSDYASIRPYAAKTAAGVKISVPPRAAVFMVVDKK
jgi:hypothetical protein